MGKARSTKIGAVKAGNSTSPMRNKIKKGHHIPYKRGETAEFDMDELTHEITHGKYKGFQGKALGSTKSLVTILCVRNLRGMKMRDAIEVTLPSADVEELTHDDMLEHVNTNGDESEDEDLTVYERGQWECSKCKAMNLNDAGYCSFILSDGEICGGKKKCEMKTWDGCFVRTAEVSFFHTICTK